MLSPVVSVREARKRLGLTQEQLGSVINRSVHTVKKYESGALKLPVGVAERIRKVLGMDEDEMSMILKNIDKTIGLMDKEERKTVLALLVALNDFINQMRVSIKCP